MICTNPYVKVLSKSRDLGTPDKAVYFPCGKCLACRINRRREWTERLLNEEVYSSSATFITLTYDENHVPIDQNGNMSVCVSDIQKFLKRLRKRYSAYKIRFFINSEYGPETGRPHYHGIIFNLPDSIYDGATRIYRNGSVSFHTPRIESVWQCGNVEAAPAGAERCSYCAKYFIDRKSVDDILTPNFSVMSRKPGIGFKYMEAITDKVRHYQSTSMISHTGNYVALPLYYKRKIYTEDERKLMFDKYCQEFELDEETLMMLNEADIVEANRIKAMTYKHKKSKI